MKPLSELLQHITLNIGAISIRQIPLKVTETYDIRHYKEGDETFKEVFNRGNTTVEREFCRRYRIPDNAGYWMCQISKQTMSTVRWNSNEHNLAPTLEESLELLINQSHINY